jgi:hypothetical protein
LHWAVSRVAGSTLDLLEDEEVRCLELTSLQCSILRQMAFPWAKLFTRLVNDYGDYQTTVDMPQAYIDALEELELLLGGGYDGPKEGCPVGEEYVNRGNPAAADFTIGAGLIADGAWRMLDLSAIVNDPTASQVRLLSWCRDTVVSADFTFRPLGFTNALSGDVLRVQVAGVYVYKQSDIYMPVLQTIEYAIMAGMDVAGVVVQGWWHPAP